MKLQPQNPRRFFTSLFGASAMLVCASILGCGPPSAAGEQKTRLDRLSIQRTALQKEVDARNDKIAQLQSELDAAKKELADLKARPVTPVVVPAPSTTPTTQP